VLAGAAADRDSHGQRRPSGASADKIPAIFKSARSICGAQAQGWVDVLAPALRPSASASNQSVTTRIAGGLMKAPRGGLPGLKAAEAAAYSREGGSSPPNGRVSCRFSSSSWFRM
jgi:hypothetical protein